MKIISALFLALSLSACAHSHHHSDGAKDPEVQLLIQRQQVEDTVNRLFIGTDNKDWAALRNIFTAEVQFDMSSLSGTPASVMTPQAITDMWTAGLTPVAAVHHQSGNFLTTVAGNGQDADVFCYGTATHYKNPTFKKKTVVSFVGSYNLHLVKIGTEWKISALKFNKKYVE